MAPSYEAVSPDVVMRIGVALTGIASVRTAMSLSMVVALYDGWFHCRQTAVTLAAVRRPAASGSCAVPVTTAPLAFQS